MITGKVLPQISVVMSIYNEPEEWLRESIESILNQTFSDFEFIIINDNPERQLNDALLKEYQKKDSRIVIIKNEENIGLTKSLNKGLKRAKGKYIARMDGDDISLNTRLKMQFDFMESNQNCIVCGTNIEYIGKKKWFTYSDWIKYDNISIKAQMFFNSGFAHPSVMIRRSILKQLNIFYDENYKQSQDYRLWEILYNLGEFANLKKKLLKYRVSKNQISNLNKKDQCYNGSNVRKRLIYNWLKKNGIIYENWSQVTPKILLNDRKKIISKTQKVKEHKAFINAFLKRLYFSDGIEKQQLIRNFYLNFDFLRFSFKTNLRFLALLFLDKDPIEW